VSIASHQALSHKCKSSINIFDLPSAFLYHRGVNSVGVTRLGWTHNAC